MSTDSGANMRSNIRTPLMPRLDEAELAELTALTEEVSYRAGEIIFSEGEDGKVAYIIFSGAVRIWTRDVAAREVTLAQLGPSDFFGELAVLDGGPRSANANAEEDTTLGGLNKEQVEQFLLSHPQVALHMIKQLGARLRQTNKLL